MRSEGSRAAPGERIRVLLMLGSLHGGGAERVAVNLARGCDPVRFDVHIGVLERGGAYDGLVDPARLHVAGADWLHDTGRNADQYRIDRALAGAVHAPRALAGLTRAVRPHVAVSFMKGLSLAAWPAMGLIGRSRPVWLAREGNNLWEVFDHELANPLGRAFIRGLTRTAYRAADGVIANSADMAQALRDRFGLAAERVHVAPNPLDLGRIAHGAAEPLADPPPRPFVVAVGRLQVQKGYDILLRAFAAAHACDGLDLVLVGDGPLRGELQALAATLGLAGRVGFAGFQANPWAWLARARAFVMASRWEGFPNALLEAMAVGAPVIAADCDFGPREAITDRVDGRLVPVDDVPALKVALDAVLSDPAHAAAMGAAAQLRAQAFGLEPSIAAYSELFERAANASSRSSPRKRGPRL